LISRTLPRATAALATAALAISLSLAAGAQEPVRHPIVQATRPSLGVTLGDPTGLTFKQYLSSGNAWDVNLGLAYGPGFRLSVDYLWGLTRAVRARQLDVNVYLGAGPMIGVLRGPCGPRFFECSGAGDLYVGARVPLGVEVALREAPFVFGIELAPGFAIAARGGFVLDFLFAARLLL